MSDIFDRYEQSWRSGTPLESTELNSNDPFEAYEQSWKGQAEVAKEPVEDSWAGWEDMRGALRGAYKGVVGLPALLADSARFVAEKTRYPLNPFGPKPPSDYQFGDITNAAMEPLERVLPVPEGVTDGKGVEVGTEFLTAGVSPIALGKTALNYGAKGVPGKIADFFSKRPALDTAAAAGGAGAAGLTAEAAPDEPLLQAAAGLGGSLALGVPLGLSRFGKSGKESYEQGLKLANKIKEQGAQALDDTAQEYAGKMATDRIMQAVGLDRQDEFLKEIEKAARRQTPGSTTAEALIDPKTGQSSFPQLFGVEQDVFSTTKGATKIQPLRQQRRQDIQNLFDDIAPDANAKRQDVGPLLQNQAEKAKSVSSDLYTNIDPKGTTRITTLKEAQQYSTFLKEMDAGLQSGALGTETKKIIGDFLKTKDPLTGRADVKSWKFLNRLRSVAGQEAERLASKPGKNFEAMLLDKLVNSIDQSAERAAKTTTGFTKTQADDWFKATKLWKQSKSLEKGIGRRDPSQIANRIITGTKETSETLAKNLGKDVNRSEIRAGLIDEIKRLTLNVDGEIKPAAFSRYVRQNKETLAPFFSKSHLNNLDKLGVQLDRMRRAKEIAGDVGAVPLNQNITVTGEIKRTFQSRLGWKYPITRKAIQALSASERAKYLAIEDRAADLLLQAAIDPQAAKLLVSKATKRNMFQAQSLSDSILNLLEPLIEIGKPLAKTLGENVGDQVVKRPIPATQFLNRTYAEKED